jgi:3-deoxy-D-arabino-heptulosonate 7-phosphate (DAHP) synthase
LDEQVYGLSNLTNVLAVLIGRVKRVISLCHANGDIHFSENAPLVVVAGPCSVENEEMIIETALR